jgi:hypothetical protein
MVYAMLVLSMQIAESQKMPLATLNASTFLHRISMLAQMLPPVQMDKHAAQN